MTPQLERRGTRRGRGRLYWDVLYRALRVALRHAHDFYAAVGIFLIAGVVLAVLCTWVFAALAGEVREGETLRFDVAVLSWMAAHQRPLLTTIALEITALGTGLVVLMVVGVSGMFLWLTRHRHSAALLFFATSSEILLNNALKLGYHRARPHVFAWATHVASSSFPSGHSMSAVVVYGTVAYLAARLQRRAWSRWLTFAAAALVIAAICTSRIYLGVHYPTDVIAGIVVGLAWAAFCMATLEAIQVYALRNAPQVLRNERPAPEDTEGGAGRPPTTRRA